VDPYRCRKWISLKAPPKTVQRDRDGTLDDGFLASEATGKQQRTATFTLML